MDLRTAEVIKLAKQVQARSYVARCRAMNIAGWAMLLRRDAAALRQELAAKGK